MTKLERITERIKGDKELFKAIAANEYYSTEDFIKDVERYIKATKEGRMLCAIDSVSASGMSRTLKFTECSKGNKNTYHFMNFYSLFLALGYKLSKDRNFFRIHGCGMDMIFDTNYENIHKFRRLGFISAAQCNHLAQQTPVVL